MEKARILVKKHWLKGLVGVLILIAVSGLFTETQDETVDLFIRPTVGPFQVTVTATGELKAKNSVKVYGPANARQQRVYEMKILRLIPEGTVVQKGDFVAELDRSELMSRIKDVEIEFQQESSEFEQTMLDTMMTLSQAREDRINLRYALEEARIQKEQAVYEAPSIQRQAEIDYERAKRAYEQSEVNYQTQVRQGEARMREREAQLAKVQKDLDELAALASQFTITAPQNGMLVYRRGWRGERLTEGGTVNAWDPVVAELPDLTTMQTVTFINEVDIQKIKIGQPVLIGLDADPDKKLTGTVTRIANIGEQHPESDAKVFEVVIDVAEVDSSLRPAMTTSNTIIIAEIPEALQIPLETIHAQDSLSYVFLREGGRPVRQEIKLGLLNENNATVVAGLEPDDLIYLSMPVDTTGIALNRLPVEKRDEQSMAENGRGNTSSDG